VLESSRASCAVVVILGGRLDRRGTIGVEGGELGGSDRRAIEVGSGESCGSELRPGEVNAEGEAVSRRRSCVQARCR